MHCILSLHAKTSEAMCCTVCQQGVSSKCEAPCNGGHAARHPCCFGFLLYRHDVLLPFTGRELLIPTYGARVEVRTHRHSLLLAEHLQTVYVTCTAPGRTCKISQPTGVFLCAKEAGPRDT